MYSGWKYIHVILINQLLKADDRTILIQWSLQIILTTMVKWTLLNTAIDMLNNVHIRTVNVNIAGRLQTSKLNHAESNCLNRAAIANRFWNLSRFQESNIFSFLWLVKHQPIVSSSTVEKHNYGNIILPQTLIPATTTTINTIETPSNYHSTLPITKTRSPVNSRLHFGSPCL